MIKNRSEYATLRMVEVDLTAAIEQLNAAAIKISPHVDDEPIYFTAPMLGYRQRLDKIWDEIDALRTDVRRRIARIQPKTLS